MPTMRTVLRHRLSNTLLACAYLWSLCLTRSCIPRLAHSWETLPADWAPLRGLWKGRPCLTRARFRHCVGLARHVTLKMTCWLSA